MNITVSYKKIFFLILSLFTYNAYSQTCSSIAMENAKSLNYLINGSSKVDYSVNKEGDRIYSIYKSGAFEIKSYCYCKNDTLHIFKGESPQYTVTGTDTTGYSIFGDCKIPLHLKVGDSLLSYSEFTTNSFSSSSRQEAYKTSSYVLGNYRYTTAILHSDIVNSQFGTGTWTHNFVNAVVAGEEKITFMGKEYTAYKITSEMWMRTVLSYSASSDDKFLDKKNEKVSKKMNKKAEKIADKMADNEEGYKVTPIESWFVPELGTYVKVLFYNSQKILVTTKVELISLN
ncbi:MAG: hypothetical protein A2046_07415 [Bacteroidetes bacterium GWA2_30_7]|nr:MAG: hypothetical protein A2046_07415 [Bacteroidetes bacterium GWA2_30_7]